MDGGAIHKKIIAIVTAGFLSGILLLGQVGLAALPNIEVVTPLILIYTLVYKKKVFYIIYTFILLEGLVHGFGIWWFSYLYVWPVLAILTLLLKKNESVILWAVLAGAFGLVFGFLCALPYFVAGGIGGGLAYWTAGIPFDIIHCISNFTVTLAVFKPVYTLLRKLEQRTR